MYTVIYPFSLYTKQTLDIVHLIIALSVSPPYRHKQTFISESTRDLIATPTFLLFPLSKHSDNCVHHSPPNTITLLLLLFGEYLAADSKPGSISLGKTKPQLALIYTLSKLLWHTSTCPNHYSQVLFLIPHILLHIHGRGTGP